MSEGGRHMTDWAGLLGEAAAAGEAMAREVPGMLADPDISRRHVKTLFAALEQHAQFCETLKGSLEAMGHDFAVVDKAAELEERFADLAAAAAEKLKSMRDAPGQQRVAGRLDDDTIPGQPAGKQALLSGR